MVELAIFQSPSSSSFSGKGPQSIAAKLSGVVTNFFGSSYSAANALVIQPDGKLVAAGATNSQGSLDFALARYAVCLPVTPDAANDGPICLGATLHLVASPTIAGATYAWTGPNGFTSSLQNPSIANVTMANAGTYHVTVTPPGCGTTPEATTNVVFFTDSTPPTITAPAALTVTQTICQ